MLGNATMWSDVESRLIVVGYMIDGETFPVSWWGQHEHEHAACDARDFARWANDEGIDSTWFNVDGDCDEFEQGPFGVAHGVGYVS